MTFNYKTSLWHNKYTITERKISDSLIIQIIPAIKENNLVVFCENGLAYLLDEDLKVLADYRVSDSGITCVEEIAPRNKTRAVVVADIEGNLNLFNLSFDTKLFLGKKAGAVTAIQGLSAGRVVVSYPLEKSTTRIEMIEAFTGNYLSSIDLVGTRRVRDFACAEAFLNLDEAWLLAGTDKKIMEIGFKGSSIFHKSTGPLREKFYLDEIICDAVGQSYVGKELYPLNEEPHYQNVPYAHDEDQKVSTISEKFKVKVITEMHRLFIQHRVEEINKSVEFDVGLCFVKHCHFPEGRIVLSASDSTLRIVDWRSNCSKFFFDC
jgi:hypothetical protein